MDPAFCVCVFLFFFFDLLVFCFLETNSTVYHCSCIVYVLFMYCLRNPQPLYEKKKGSHGIIYSFKNYFAIVFSVFSFQFQQNKFYSNRPYILDNCIGNKEWLCSARNCLLCLNFLELFLVALLKYFIVLSLSLCFHLFFLWD